MTALPAHEIYQLPTRRLGRRVLFFPRVDSTNSLALSLAHDLANDGLVLTAAEQTAGRGQFGRTWAALPGSSVLLSVVLFPPPALRRPALLTAWAAVSVCETILEISGLEAKIKWPNDVLVQGRKVCGILIEQRNTGLADFTLASAVGIGLNVQQSADFFAQANLPLAGSLASLSGKHLETRNVADRLIARLDQAYDRLLMGDTQDLGEEWKKRLDLVGKDVDVELVHGHIAGRMLELSWERVVFAQADQVVEIAPESVRHMTERAPA